MKIFDNTKIFVRLILLVLLSWFLLGCNSLTKQAKFYAQHPHLIPTLNKQVSQTMHLAADTLTQMATMDISKQNGTTGERIPLSRLYTFENEKSKTTISINVAEITSDSLPFEVQTIVKPNTITQDTTIAYQQYQFNHAETKPSTMWKRWSNKLYLVLLLLIAVFVLLLRSIFRR